MAAKRALTITAAGFALALLAGGSAMSQSIFMPYRASPPYGYFVWRGPDGYPPMPPAARSVPLVDYLAMNPGWSPPVTTGCYFTRARMNNAWKRVQVCY